jgi:hypothetical protein
MSNKQPRTDAIDRPTPNVPFPSWLPPSGQRAFAISRLTGFGSQVPPGRAGDGAGDRRQARIGRALPVEAIAHHRDGVALALILANEHRAGLEVAARWPGVVGEAVQVRQAVAIKTPEGLFLDSHRDHAAQEFPAQTGRGLAAEHRPPAPPKRVRRKRADDRSRDRGPR